MTDGPINLKIELTPGSRQRKSGEYLYPSPASGGSWTANCSPPPIRVPIARPINARGHTADDGPDIEETRRHCRDPEDAFRIQHPHDQGSHGYHDDEGEHDPR